MLQIVEDQMNNFDELVKKELEDKRKTKKELADFLGVSEHGLTKMLRRGTFKSDYMVKIAKFLEVDVNFFGLNMKEKSDNVSQQPPVASSDETKVESLKQVIAAKDEVIKAKDEMIQILKQKLKE